MTTVLCKLKLIPPFCPRGLQNPEINNLCLNSEALLLNRLASPSFFVVNCLHSLFSLQSPHAHLCEAFLWHIKPNLYSVYRLWQVMPCTALHTWDRCNWRGQGQVHMGDGKSIWGAWPELSLPPVLVKTDNTEVAGCTVFFLTTVRLCRSPGRRIAALLFEVC